MIVQYNWAAIMSRTLLRDIKPKNVIEELGTVVEGQHTLDPSVLSLAS